MIVCTGRCMRMKATPGHQPRAVMRILTCTHADIHAHTGNMELDPSVDVPPEAYDAIVSFPSESSGMEPSLVHRDGPHDAIFWKAAKRRKTVENQPPKVSKKWVAIPWCMLR
jgi:hypothetical protein